VGITQFLEMPDHRTPGLIRDIHFKFCGEKIKKSDAFREFVETQVPKEFKGHFSKSEKGVDMEICCDAFKLAAASKLERLFLLTNDSDFVPFCRTIKDFGANISLIHLSKNVTTNADLVHEVDTYDVIPRDALNLIFLPVSEHPLPPESVKTQYDASALKPEAEPSALSVKPDETLPSDADGGGADSHS
jgi:hypothetical protein